MQSALVETPTLLGWVRPMILLPPSALLGLTSRQLEMVLAHELAHLARYDHVVNFFQVVVETLLFYHPAVWWLSRRIREERELCCDDCAMALFDNRREYASALTLLETYRAGYATPGLAATGGPLMLRVRRLLAAPEHGAGRGRLVAGLLLLAGLTGIFGMVSVEAANRILSRPEMQPADEWVEVSFPANSVGTICVREPGTDSFFDWRETNPAAGTVLLPPNVEAALKVDAGQAQDLSFLDALPSNAFTGLLLGVFYQYRAGNEPPEQVYDDILQTDRRPRMPVYNEDMVHVSAFEGLRDLYLDHSFVGDTGVAELAVLTSLEVLSLVDTEATDASMAYLAELPNLRRLNLSQTSVTDAGMAYLASSRSLEDITLDRTAITNAGLAYLAKIEQLQRLSVNFTPITDVGLSYLAEHPSLVTLRTWNTDTSEEMREAVARGTGQLEFGLPTPRVGIILSDFNARTGEHWMQYEYTYRHPMGIARLLIDLGYDLYAVVEPGTEGKGRLPEVLKRLGLQDRVIDATNSAALEQLDAVVSGFDADVLDSVQGALMQSVKKGLGFFNTCLWGVVYPGKGAALEEFLGIGNPQYSLQFEYVQCDVAASHPILGDLRPGDQVTAKWPNGFVGDLRGTSLLLTRIGKDQQFSPLYVYDLGQGRVVNFQCQQVTITNGGIDPVAFYGRCLNYAAKVPVDATW